MSEKTKEEMAREHIEKTEQIQLLHGGPQWIYSRGLKMSFIAGFDKGRESESTSWKALHDINERCINDQLIQITTLRTQLDVAVEGIRLMGLGDWSAISGASDKYDFSVETLTKIEAMNKGEG